MYSDRETVYKIQDAPPKLLYPTKNKFTGIEQLL